MLTPKTLAALGRAQPPRLFVLGGHAGPRASSAAEQRIVASNENFVPAPAGLAVAGTEAGAWLMQPPMPMPRQFFSAAAGGGLVYVVGGRGPQEEALSSAASFCPARGRWMALPALLEARYHCCAAAVEGTLLVAGGFSGDAELLASVEHLPLVAPAAASAWQASTPLPSPRARCAAIAAANESGVVSFVVIGGADAGYRSLADAVRLAIVGPAAASGGAAAWETFASLTTPRYCCAAAKLGAGIAVAGGISDGWTPLDTVELYDAVRDRWDFLAPMDRPRRDFAFVAAGTCLYAVGGVTLGGRVTASAERFEASHSLLAADASADAARCGGGGVVAAAWEALPPMSAARCACAAAATWV